jgi:hypothetical protein
MTPCRAIAFERVRAGLFEAWIAVARRAGKGALWTRPRVENEPPGAMGMIVETATVFLRFRARERPDLQMFS